MPAHALLIITGAVTAGMTFMFRVRLPFSIGSIGMALAAIALTFHETTPDFRYLIITLLAANLFGHFTVRLEKCIWVRWSLMLLTVFAAQWWTYRIVLPVLNEPSAAAAARTQLPWFLAGIGLFGFTYLVIAAWEIIAGKFAKINFYYLALPTMTVLWSFGCAQYVTTVLGSSNYLVNLLGLAVSALHIAVVWVLSRKRADQRFGLGAICNAGAMILALSLPTVVGSALYALPVLSAAAYILLIFSGIWQSGGARLTSYLLQVHAGAYLMFLMVSGRIHEPVIAIVASAIMSAVAYFHYHWARANAPARDIRFFARTDQKDLSAALMLLMALVSGFFALQGVSLLVIGTGNNAAVIAVQSVIINASAAWMVIWGYLGRDVEKRNISILLILLGAFKVIFHDLAGTTGVALVASVLSFGIATAILSVVMSRWQKRVSAGEADRRPDAA